MTIQYGIRSRDYPLKTLIKGRTKLRNCKVFFFYVGPCPVLLLLLLPSSIKWLLFSQYCDDDPWSFTEFVESVKRLLTIYYFIYEHRDSQLNRN